VPDVRRTRHVQHAFGLPIQTTSCLS